MKEQNKENKESCFVELGSGLILNVSCIQEIDSVLKKLYTANRILYISDADINKLKKHLNLV